MQKTIYILGGDKRFSYLRGLLTSACSKTEALSNYFKCDTSEDTDFYPRKIESADIIILPYPLTFDGINLNAPNSPEPIPLKSIFSYLLPHQLLLTGGEVPKEFKTTSSKIRNYAKDENLLRKNAFLTAEGLLKLVIEELPITLSNLSVAITGYGRVGRATAILLSKVGCLVTVFARSEKSRDEAQKDGLQALEYKYFAPLGEAFDCIINTVPELVIDEDVLRCLRPECRIFEAASAPYGIDFKAADALGLKSIIAGSLPGKTSPLSAAEIICESVLKICFEGG